VCFAVALVGLTALLIGTLSYTRARRALETTAAARLDLLARDVAAKIGIDLEDRAADITNWAELEIMRALLYRDVDKELAHFLDQTLRRRPAHAALVAVDASGDRIAGAGAVEVARPAVPASRPTWSLISHEGRALLQFQTPVRHPDRPAEVIGVLAALFEPPVVGGPQDAAAPATLAIRARTGAVLVDTRPLPRGPLADTERDPAVLTARAPIRSLGTDGPALDVVLFEPAAVAFADVTALRTTLVQTGLVVVALGALFGALVAWRIGLPIRQLTTTVREVAERGQLEPQASFPDTGGEVGVLSAAFRAMLESLARSQQETLAQSRLAFLGEIAANVAHEVRTPLSVLKTTAQLLARDGMPADEQRQLATTAAAEVDRLNTVVTNLVDLARPRPVRYADEPVGAIVDRAVSFFRPLAAKHGVEVTRAGLDAGLVVHGSADQLHQVLLNLLQNALQAMGRPGAITVTSHAEDGWVRLAVDDTGPGFAPDVLPRVFAPFVTTRTDGTGLGLAIVKRMVEEHGGTVGAENRAEGGARVWARLPLRKEPAAR
jgi:signal transduction histidine kinase